MNHIQLFEQDQEEKFRRKMEINERYRQRNNTLTDEEKARLEELKEKFYSNNKVVSIVTTSATGETVEVDALEYFKSVDDNMEKMNDGLKLVNASDENILASATTAVTSVQNILIDQIRAYCLDSEITDERIAEIISKVSSICKKELGRSDITSDLVSAYFEKKTFKYMQDVFPADVISAFVPEEDIFDDPRACKTKLTEIFSTMIIAKDEITSINEYIDHNEKVVQILMRLEQCGHDLAEELKSPEKFAEAVARTREDTGEPRLNEIADKYKDYFKVRVNGSYDYFTIRFVMMKEMAKAYEKVIEEYTDPEDIEVIQNEIEESEQKALIYLDVANLDTFREVYEAYESAAKSDKRTNRKGLETQGRSYIEKIKKSKVNVAFPGYRPEMENASEIYLAYVKRMDDVIKAHNAAVDKAKENGLNDLDRIECNTTTFAGVLLIVMGRLLKKLTKNTAHKLEMLEVNSYFQRFAQFGLDLFSLDEVYKIIRPMIDFIDGFSS